MIEDLHGQERDYDWARYKSFVDHHAKRDFETDAAFDFSLAALGLAGEAGEVADLVKKWIYHGAPFDRQKFILEMGDQFWYWTRLCSLLNTTPKEIMAANVAKLEARYPSGAFSTAESVARRDEATEHLYIYGD